MCPFARRQVDTIEFLRCSFLRHLFTPARGKCAEDIAPKNPDRSVAKQQAATEPLDPREWTAAWVFVCVCVYMRVFVSISAYMCVFGCSRRTADTLPGRTLCRKPRDRANLLLRRAGGGGGVRTTYVSCRLRLTISRDDTPSGNKSKQTSANKLPAIDCRCTTLFLLFFVYPPLRNSQQDSRPKDVVRRYKFVRVEFSIEIPWIRLDGKSVAKLRFIVVPPSPTLTTPLGCSKSGSSRE